MRDWIFIGSTGFAQVGDNDYWAKNKIEQEVIFKMLQEKEEFHFPEPLKHLMSYQWKAQHHDFGTYHELVVNYDMIIDTYEESDDPETVELYNLFWNFINNLESFDWESEEMMEKCEELYYETYPEKQCKVIELKQAV